MARKKAKIICHGLAKFAVCPFCGTVADASTTITWCSGCYVEFFIHKNGNIYFDDALKSKRFALAKAAAKAGGFSLGKIQTTRS